MNTRIIVFIFPLFWAGIIEGSAIYDGIILSKSSSTLVQEYKLILKEIITNLNIPNFNLTGRNWSFTNIHMEFVTFKESFWNPEFRTKKNENGTIEIKIEGDGSVIDVKFSFHFKYENGAGGLWKGDCEYLISSTNFMILQILEDSQTQITTSIQVEFIRKAFLMTHGDTYANKNTVTSDLLKHISNRFNDELNKNTERFSNSLSVSWLHESSQTFSQDGSSAFVEMKQKNEPDEIVVGSKEITWTFETESSFQEQNSPTFFLLKESQKREISPESSMTLKINMQLFAQIIQDLSEKGLWNLSAKNKFQILALGEMFPSMIDLYPPHDLFFISCIPNFTLLHSNATFTEKCLFIHENTKKFILEVELFLTAEGTFSAEMNNDICIYSNLEKINLNQVIPNRHIDSNSLIKFREFLNPILDEIHQKISLLGEKGLILHPPQSLSFLELSKFTIESNFLKLDFQKIERVPDKKLFFNKNSTFKVLQLTDNYLGEDEKKMENRIRWENPDVVVLKGDMPSGYNQTPDSSENLWREFTQIFRTHEIFFMLTFGNQDKKAYLTTKEIIALDALNPWSLSQLGPDSIKGASNYMTSILSPTSSSLEYILWAFDSNTKNSKENQTKFELSQVKWYEQLSNDINQQEGRVLPGFSFFQIIPPNLEINNPSAVAKKLKPWTLVEKMKEIGNIEGMAFGDPPNSELKKQYDGINMYYAANSGVDGEYNSENRVFLFHLNENHTVTYETWISTAKGKIYTTYD